jgi:hypothetical protein
MKHLILKISTLSLVSMLILSSCGNGSKEKITLQYNFKQGDVLKQNMVMSMDLVQKAMGQEMKINLVMSSKTTLDVKESREDSYALEVKFKELKTEIKMPNLDAAGTISFDSNTDDDVATQTNLGPMFKAVIDKPFEVVMTNTGKVKSVKGLETFVESMLNSFDENVSEDIRQQMATQFGSQFSEEAFKSQFEQNTRYFSDKPVGVGDSWNVKMETTASNFAITVDVKSSVKSIEGNDVNLNIDGTVSTPAGYEQDFNGVKAKVSLKGTQKGTMKVSKDTGWVISSDIMMNFNGEIEIEGMKVPVYAASKITVTSE